MVSRYCESKAMLMFTVTEGVEIHFESTRFVSNRSSNTLPWLLDEP